MLRYSRALADSDRQRSRPVHLVACVKAKGPGPAPARDLYSSDWFKKARAYVEARGGPWFILSAEHGLLDPAQVIAPYERSLVTMSAQERRDWGARVVAQLAQSLDAQERPLVVLAGRAYREQIVEWAGRRASVPMEGLGLGEQKAWLAAEKRAA